jgi:acetyl esterase/lipase
MIYMYGGGWAFGGRGGDFSYLTDIGVQVISIDYRKGLTKYGYNPAPPEEMEKAIDMALDDLTDAMAFVLSRADEWKVDKDKVMLSGSSAGGITTLLSIYDICNDGPYSKKFPEGWMPAGYIGYAGAIINRQQELSWAKTPCPMMFFHGSADFTVTVDVQR